MSIEFSCPECGESIVLRSVKAGRLEQCLDCGAEFEVPADAKGLEEWQAVSLAARAERREEERHEQGKRTREVRRREAPRLEGPKRYAFFRALSPVFLVLGVLDGLYTVFSVFWGLRVGVEPSSILIILLIGGTGTLILLGLSQGILVLLEILEHVRPGRPPNPGTA